MEDAQKKDEEAEDCLSGEGETVVAAAVLKGGTTTPRYNVSEHTLSIVMP